MQRKLEVLAVAMLAFGFSLGTSDAYENCNGIGYFALQVPDPGAIVVDGRGNDWRWFDPDFIVGTDQMCSTLGNPMPDKDDLDVAIHIGWTPEPDNRLYGFVRVVDDTLKVEGTNMDAGWQEDGLEFILDPDHAGGWHQAADALRTGHQQWTFTVAAPGGYPRTAWLRFNQPPEMQWAVNEGLVEAATHVEPYPATMVPDATVGYEVRMAAFDPYMPDGVAASIRHAFVAGQTIGLSVTLNEADTGGRKHQISTHVREAGAHDSDYTSEFTLLGIGDYVTAVENSSWGAVKALLRR